MIDDPEMLALPLGKMGLSGATTKPLKALGIKKIADLMAKTHAELLRSGVKPSSLKEIAEAAKDLSLTWTTLAEIEAAYPETVAAPIEPSLPKKILAMNRFTFVLLDTGPPRATAVASLVEQVSERPCGNCGKPMSEVFNFDLTAFPQSGLPACSVRFLRCESCAVELSNDETGLVDQKAWRVSVGAPSAGQRPRFRREYDYPYPGHSRLETLDPSDATDEKLFDHKKRVIGHGPRVSGWANRFEPVVETYSCTSCGQELVLAFEQYPPESMGRKEHLFICPKGCASGFAYCTSIR